MAPPPRPQIRRHFLLTVSSYLDKTHAFMPLMSKKPLLCNSTIMAVLRSIRRMSYPRGAILFLSVAKLSHLSKNVIYIQQQINTGRWYWVLSSEENFISYSEAASEQMEKVRTWIMIINHCTLKITDLFFSSMYRNKKSNWLFRSCASEF